MLKRLFSTNTPSVVNSSLRLAFLYDFPLHWDAPLLRRTLDAQGEILRVTPLLNALGLTTGKFVVEFRNELYCKRFIEKYRENMLDLPGILQKVGVRQWQLQRPVIRMKKEKLEGQWARLKNLDFNMNEAQLRSLLQDYGQVEQIEMPFSETNQQNKGQAFVKFTDPEIPKKLFAISKELTLMDRKVFVEYKDYGRLVVKKSQRLPSAKEKKRKWKSLRKQSQLLKELD